MPRLVPNPERVTPNEEQRGTWDAFFWVRDAKTLHEGLATSGAEVAYGPIVQEAYTMEEFAVRDEDGHVLGSGNPWSDRTGRKESASIPFLRCARRRLARFRPSLVVAA